MKLFAILLVKIISFRRGCGIILELEGAGTGVTTIKDGHVCDYSSNKPINQRIVSGNGQTARIWFESGEAYCLDLLN